MISQDKLKQCLYYSPIVGAFEWRRSGRGVRRGFLAGCVNKQSGYVMVIIDGKPYAAHRLAWLYMTGSMPDQIIDHIDGDRSNNAFSNLRLSSYSQNSWNQKLSAASSSGVKGVTFRPDAGKWQGRFRASGKTYWLGYFDSKEEADKAVRKKRTEIHGEFANHGLHGYEQEELLKTY